MERSMTLRKRDKKAMAALGGDDPFACRRLPEDWVYEPAAECWQDGLILGNGNLGVVGYAPYGLEWTINKGDIFDGRRDLAANALPDREVMARVERERAKSLEFLSEAERPPTGAVSPLTKIAALLKLKFGEEDGWAAARPHAVRQRLSLAEGVLHNDLDMHLSHPRIDSFVPRDRNLFCLRIAECGGAQWGHTLKLARPHDEDLDPPRWGGENGLLWMEQAMPHEGARYAVALLAVPTADASANDPFARALHPRCRDFKSRVGAPEIFQFAADLRQDGNADVFLAVFTSYEEKNPLEKAIREVRKAAREGYEALAAENAAWWRRFWKTGSADFGAEREIQKYWDFSLYETACLLGRAPVPGLYGLWHGDTDMPRRGVGAGWYTHDQNVQMPMFPVFPLNRLDLLEPYIETYRRALPALRRETRRLFDCPGVCIPLTMNQVGNSLTAGAYRYSLCGGPYTGLVFAWAWRYAPHRLDLAEKIYPILKEIVRFHLSRLKSGADGQLHLDWEIPPEIFSLSRDSVVTLALLKPCLQTLVEIAQALGQDEAARRRWQATLECYPAFPRRAGGDWWAGADIREDHYTQAAYLLYPFFPAEAAVTPADERTAALTLEKGLEHDIERSFADEAGRWHYKRCWAWFFPTVTRLRLGLREAGWAALHDCLRLFAKPNGLFTHNPVVAVDPATTEANLKQIPAATLSHPDGIHAPVSEFWCHDMRTAGTLHPNAKRWVTPVAEGSAAFLFAATETLLQSHGGLIRLFPGVPPNFSGGFTGFLAQGGIEISAAMRKGRVTMVSLRAAGDVTAHILEPSDIKPPEDVEIVTENGRCVWRVPLEAGRTRMLLNSKIS